VEEQILPKVSVVQKVKLDEPVLTTGSQKRHTPQQPDVLCLVEIQVESEEHVPLRKRVGGFYKGDVNDEASLKAFVRLCHTASKASSAFVELTEFPKIFNRMPAPTRTAPPAKPPPREELPVDPPPVYDYPIGDDDEEIEA